MLNENRLRLILFIAIGIAHILLILFFAIDVGVKKQEPPELASVLKLTDLTEYAPPPPEAEQIPIVETIAETMIETETVPEQIVVAAGTIINVIPPREEEVFLAAHQVSVSPKFDANAIIADLVYPPIALRAGIEGRVILELFVDRTGVVQNIIVLREEPEGRGFGEAAIKAFTNRKGEPAIANGEPVSARFRWPVTFKIK